MKIKHRAVLGITTMCCVQKETVSYMVTISNNPMNTDPTLYPRKNVCHIVWVINTTASLLSSLTVSQGGSSAQIKWEQTPTNLLPTEKN